MGEAPDRIVLVQTEEEVDDLVAADPERVAFVSQTTLSVDETRSMIAAPARALPGIVGPRKDDICYATTNRQAAVKQMAERVDLMLVVGSPNSSNSHRMVDVARDLGTDAHLIDNRPRSTPVAGRQADGRRQLGGERAGGARRAASSLRSARAAPSDVEEFEPMREDVRFMLPKVIREAASAARS